MRYKVRAPNPSSYQEILHLLSGRVPIFVASEKRQILSTGDLPEDCLQEIAAKGGQVKPDVQYDLELTR